MTMLRRSILLALVAALLITAGCRRVPNYRLASLSILPAAPVFAVGQNAQLTVVALFTSGTTILAWNQVTWRTSDPAVATVSTNGLVTGVAPGTATISVIDNAHPELTASVTAIVTETPLLSIDVTPAFTTLTGTGLYQQFTATGIYSAPGTTTVPGPTMDLTQLAVWTSSNLSVAVVSNVTGSGGIVTATGFGISTIAARDAVSGINGSTLVAVLPSALDSLAVEPAVVSAPAGTALRFSAIYSAGTWTGDLTSLATWTTSNALVATVSDSLGTKGLVTPLASGTTEIIATDPRTSITGTALLTVP